MENLKNQKDILKLSDLYEYHTVKLKYRDVLPHGMATPISVMRFVTGQSSLRNWVLLMIALRQTPLANGDKFWYLMAMGFVDHLGHYMPHFTAFGMINLQYEIRICHNL